MVPLRLAIAVLALHVATHSSAIAVTLGESDTFDSGTTENWTAGGGPNGGTPPVPPEVAPDGGPGGAGDEFLEITGVGGNGPGSRLTAMNILAQWAGNYLAAGVGAIGMDLRNLGDSDLTIRLLFEDPIPGPPANEAVTTTGFLLPTGTGWTHVIFPIAPADLTPLLGDATTVLGNTTVLRILHSPSPTEAVPIAGVLGVDNITALARPVPESPVLALIAVAFIALATVRGIRSDLRDIAEKECR